VALTVSAKTMSRTRLARRSASAEDEVTDTVGETLGVGEDEVTDTGGEDEVTDTVGDGKEAGKGEDADDKDVDGWSEICCTAATGWFEAVAVGGGEPVAARAAPAATAAIATPAAIAALTGLKWRSLIRRRRGTRCAVVPCTVGGAPEGHSAASRSAASPRCDRPRSCQCRP
jgi:hypothetical protein